jgi:hypothetical protein
MNIEVERDVIDLGRLARRLAERSPEDLAAELADLERARNTLNQVIGRAREGARHAA